MSVALKQSTRHLHVIAEDLALPRDTEHPWLSHARIGRTWLEHEAERGCGSFERNLAKQAEFVRLYGP
jgi:hypothetical protein